MDYFHEILDTGDDIMSKISRAVDSNDYSGLAGGIKNDVNDLSRKISEDVKEQQRAQRAARQAQAQQQKQDQVEHIRQTQQMRAEQTRQQRTAWQAGQMKRMSTPYFMARPKNSSGWKRVLGIIMVICFGSTVFSTISDGGSAAEAVAYAVAAAAGAILAAIGFMDKKTYRAYYKYGRIIGGNEFIDIHKLAVSAAETDDNVHDQLKRMVRKGYFPRGRFDEQETTLMLTDEAWQKYCDARAVGERIEKARAQQQAAEESSANAEALARGRDFLDYVSSARAQVKGSAMDGKLERLSYIVRKILDKVRESDEKVPAMNKFTGYYLPTTEKLIRSYVDLSDEPEIGKNVPETKKEIEDAMDSVTDAFKVVYDGLYQRTAWDVSSDITVMKAMMQQDGIAGQGGSEAGSEGKD
jgi:hypothetical protein